MSRLIDKDALLNGINKILSEHLTIGVVATKIIDAIKDAPTIEPKQEEKCSLERELNKQRMFGYYDRIAEELKEEVEQTEPKQEWIPCEERLPEENGFYLVTADHWHDKAFRSTDLYSFIDGKWYTVHDDIIAWMSLPEPWNGEISE